MMKIRLIALMSLAGVIALSGCTVGPDYKRPTLDVPLEYRQISKEVEDNAQWLTARWWTQYQDPAIDALVSSAIKNNRTLQQTMSNVEKAAAAVTVARADLFPQLNYQAMRCVSARVSTLLWVKRSKGNLSVRKKSWLVHHGKSTCGAKSAGKLKVLRRL